MASLKALKPQLVAILAVREQQETLPIDTENRFVAFPLSHVQAAYFVGRQSVFEYGGLGVMAILRSSHLVGIRLSWNASGNR